MVLTKKLSMSLIIAFALTTFVSCSSSEEEEDIEASAENIEEPENASFNNNSQQATDQAVANGEEAENQGQSQANFAEEGEAVNNATEEDALGAETGDQTALLNSQQGGEEFLDTSNQMQQQTATGNVPLQNGSMGMNNAAAMNAAATTNVPANVPMNAAPVNAGMAAPPSNVLAAPTNGMTQPPMNAAMQQPAAPMGGGTVRYVRVPRIDVYNQPTNAAPSNSLEQGEHPVTWSEGQWTRMHDGRFVKSDGLTDQGIARPRKKRNWQ